MKARNISIDILKFIAAILITNSHMDSLYLFKYRVFATGGAIGDALFFFTIGFVLFLKPMGRFDNWYKKRVNRIYPTVFAWAILATLFFDKNDNIIHIILYGGAWFITCIMIHYVVLYLINRYMIKKLTLATIIATLIIIVWFFLLDKPSDYNMYGATYFKWGHFFLFTLFGAILGISKKKLVYKFNWDILKLLVSVFIYYGILIISRKVEGFFIIQLSSLLPLAAIVFYFYKIANSDILKRLYQSKRVGVIMQIISGLCLEIYLVQYDLFTEEMNSIFPLNLIIMFAIILIAAYFLRCLARIFAQIFKDQEFDWKLVFRLY